MKSQKEDATKKANYRYCGCQQQQAIMCHPTLKVAAYFARHTNAEAKLQLLDPMHILRGREGSVPGVSRGVCSTWFTR